MSCGPGTYVRCLAEDLGMALGCGAHLAELQRTRSGPFGLDEAMSFPDLEARAAAGEEIALIPPVEVLGLPTLSLNAEQVRRMTHGADIAVPPRQVPPTGTRLVALDPAGTLLGILEVRLDRRLYPLRVLAPEGAF